MPVERRAIPGYPGYSIDRLGVVRHLSSILEPRETQEGYVQYALYDPEGNRRDFYGHDLMAKVGFVKGRGSQVDHVGSEGSRSGKGDNRASHLRKVTPKENTR